MSKENETTAVAMRVGIIQLPLMAPIKARAVKLSAGAAVAEKAIFSHFITGI